MKKMLVFTFLCLFSSVLTAQALQSARPFFLGHSLVNFDMPAMVAGLAADAGKTYAYEQQIINGAPLGWQWDNAADAQGTPYYDAFPNGNHDVFILTEAVPLQNHLDWSNTYGNALNFINYARNNSQVGSVRHFVYETWHCIYSGQPSGCDWDNGDTLLWQPRLLADFPLWAGIVEHLRTALPNETVAMIPAGQAFQRLTTAINQGELPGINSFEDLFSDDIHLTNAGNYFVACVMYACIFKESPQGLTQQLNNEWGGAFSNMPSPAQAAKMQEIAWNTVLDLSEWTEVEAILNTELLQFSAHALPTSSIELAWLVDPIQDLQEFVVEHSTNGRQFNSIAVVSNNRLEAANRFRFVHEAPLAATNYYRLKLVSADNSYTYSPLRLVQLREKLSKVYPNPTKEHLFVEIANTTTPAVFRLYDAQGQLRLSQYATGSITVSSLVSGVYLLEIQQGQHREWQRIVIK